jgi:hypothetical protein
MRAQPEKLLSIATKQELLLEVLAKCSQTRLRVNGTSMLPALLPYDVVILRRAGINELSRGDIVLVENNGSLLLHRIVNLGAGWAQTRGDFLLHDDAPLQIDRIHAKVVAVERFGHELATVPGVHSLAQVVARVDQAFRWPSSLAHIYARVRTQLFSRLVAKDA